MVSQIDPSKELIDFVSEHIQDNPSALLMRYSNKELPFDIRFAVIQIQNRNKARRKISGFLSHPEFLFPDLISSEQASGERVAKFHANLVGKNKTIVDLTAGLGIDAMTMAQHGNKVTAIELDETKAATLRYNSEIFKLKGFNVVFDDCTNYIKHLESFPDVFFIDPARRDSSKKRTYALSDCLPDITQIYPQLINNGSDLFIKVSPLLDVTAILKELDNIAAIYVISVRNECKEVLIHLRKESGEAPKIHAVDLDDNGIKSHFTMPQGNKEHGIISIASENDLCEGGYLYEPNASLMKLNAEKEICSRYPGIKKLSNNTELYVSPTLIKDFPGRIIQIVRVLSSKQIKSLKGEGFSIVSRNYPLTADELRKKIGAKESSERFIYAFRVGIKEKPVLLEGKRMEA